eukprot:UC1_evm2s1619
MQRSISSSGGGGGGDGGKYNQGGGGSGSGGGGSSYSNSGYDRNGGGSSGGGSGGGGGGGGGVSGMRGSPSRAGRTTVSRLTPMTSLQSMTSGGDGGSGSSGGGLAGGMSGLSLRPGGSLSAPAKMIPATVAGGGGGGGRGGGNGNNGNEPRISLPNSRRPPPAAVGGGGAKPRSDKKKKLSREQVRTLMRALLDVHLDSLDTDEACASVKELAPARKFRPMLVAESVLMLAARVAATSDASTTAAPIAAKEEATSRFLAALVHANVLEADDLAGALEDLLDQLRDLKLDTKQATLQVVGGVFARAHIDGIMSLGEQASVFNGGQHADVFISILQGLLATLGEADLMGLVASEKLDLMSVLPPGDRHALALGTLLRGAGLQCLDPALALETALRQHLTDSAGTLSQLQSTKPSECSSAAAGITTWLDARQETQPLASSKRARTVSATILGFALNATTLLPGADANRPDKHAKEAERALVSALAPVLIHVSGASAAHQAAVVHGLQMACFAAGFPRGLMLRLAMLLYDLDVVEEEAWMHWREDLDDEVPGKGQALIAVNEYLNWMKAAEEESESESEVGN